MFYRPLTANQILVRLDKRRGSSLNCLVLGYADIADEKRADVQRGASALCWMNWLNPEDGV